MPPVLQIGRPLSTNSAVVRLPLPLPRGRYRVTLSVTGPSGTSAPATLTVIIR